MARPLKPLVHSGGWYPSKKWIPLVRNGGYTTANGGEQPGPALKTVTGSLIHITDALALPAEALTVNVEPVQDLHGYDSPWPAGGGKNLVDTNALIGTTGAGYNKYGWKNVLKNNTTYTFSVFGDNTYGYRLMAGHTMEAVPQPNVGLSSGYIKAGNRNTFTTPSDVEDWEYLFLGGSASGGGQGNNTFMIELGENTNPTFSPYSNICPISGRTSATVTRCGKNLLDISTLIEWVDKNGLTIKKHDDGSFTLSGTATATDYQTIFVYLKAGNYILSGCPSGGSNTTYSIYIGGGINKYDTGNGVAFTVLTDRTYNVVLPRVISDTVCNNLVFKPMIRLASDSDETFEPYAGNTYTIAFGDTVYGGTLDVTGGKMVVDRAMVDLGTIAFAKSAATSSSGGSVFSIPVSSVGLGMAERARYTPNNILSDVYKTASTSTWWISELPDLTMLINTNALIIADSRYSTAADFRAAVSGVQLCYELATPLEITLTPTQIDMLLGTNNLWADAGDSTLTYYAEGEASTSEALGILLGGTYNNPGGADDASDDEALGILLGGS